MSDFPVPRSHIEAGLSAVGARCAAFEYDSLVLSSVEAFEAGSREAPLVPYVRFMVDATLESLNHYTPLGSEAQQAYREVAERVNVASRYAKAIIRFDTDLDYPELVNPFFENLYTSFPILRAITEEDETMPQAFVVGRSYMSGLISTTFSDVGAASGGAIRLLLLQETYPDMAGVSIRQSVIASDGLRLLGAIPKAVAHERPDVWGRLGRPYIRTRRLAVSEGGPVPEVVFNPGTAAFIGKLGKRVPGSGCPANKIQYVPPGQEAKTSAMREGWADAAGFLVPADATVNKGA